MFANPPVTLVERLGAIGMAAIMACMIFGIAYGLHSAISKNSPTKRIQGGPVAWWVTASMFVGSCFGAWIADNQSYYLHEVVGGMGGFGLLIGLTIGNLHGLVNLYWVRSTDESGPEMRGDAVSVATDSHEKNPYESPRLP